MGPRKLCRAWLLPALACGLLLPPVAEARITHLVIDRIESPTFGGTSFGNAGPYERVVGRAFGEVDPNDPQSAIITDIDKAPRNSLGRVEYQTDFYLLKPVDATRGNGLLFHSILNRGGKINFNTFNVGASSDNEPQNAGDGFTMKRGWVYLWSGWQADLFPGNNRLLLRAPVATDSGAPITGRIRTEYRVPAPAGTTQNLSGSPVASGYETASLDNTTATLTRRVHAADAREIIPPDRWAFADCSTTPFPGVPSRTKVCLADGFDTNHIYELVYTAKNPPVLGLGFASTRDLVAFFRHAAQDDAGTPNPLAGAIQYAMAEGTSQAGAYLNSFVHLGFNQDEAGRTVFDGVNPHVFTMRLSLNVRFGQPTQLPYNSVGSEAPFTWSSLHDPIAGRTGGLLRRCEATGTCPKILHTLSSSEYWRSRMTSASLGPASLLTTDALARHDVGIPSNVRIYHITGTQHAPAAPPAPWCQQMNNPSPHQETRRALLAALERWVIQGVEPPPSEVASLRSGTLVPVDAKSVGWPAIPGVAFPGNVNSLRLLYFGPAFNHEDTSGVITEPSVDLGKSYAVRVPKVDADGNEVAGVRSTTQQAPLGTYTGWNFLRAGFGEGDLCDIRQLGSFIPFRRTQGDRVAAGDPRLSLEERYGSHAGYVSAVQAAASDLVAKGFLLTEDAARLVAAAEASNVLR
jgi:hypothetical protein